MSSKNPKQCLPRTYLKLLRKQNKTSTLQVAERLGHARQVYERYENGVKDFSSEKLTYFFDTLAEMFGISLSALYAAEADYQHNLSEIRPIAEPNFEARKYDTEQTRLACNRNLSNIEIIDKSIGIDLLTPRLREVVKIRLKHRNWSYGDIVEQLSVNELTILNLFREITKIARKVTSDAEIETGK